MSMAANLLMCVSHYKRDAVFTMASCLLFSLYHPVCPCQKNIGITGFLVGSIWHISFVVDFQLFNDRFPPALLTLSIDLCTDFPINLKFKIESGYTEIIFNCCSICITASTKPKIAVIRSNTPVMSLDFSLFSDFINRLIE